MSSETLTVIVPFVSTYFEGLDPTVLRRMVDAPTEIDEKSFDAALDAVKFHMTLTLLADVCRTKIVREYDSLDKAHLESLIEFTDAIDFLTETGDLTLLEIFTQPSPEPAETVSNSFRVRII